MWWWWWRPGLHIRSIFISREFIYTFSFISNLRNNLCYYWNCWKRMQNERWNNSERYFSVFSFIWRPFKHTHIRIRCAIKYHQICHLSARILRAYETKTILRKKKNKEKITLIHELVSNMCHLLHTQTLWSHRLHLRNTCIMLRWHSPCCANADTHRTEAKWKKRKRKTTNGKYQWKWVRKKKRKRGNLRNENALTSHILQLTLSVSQTAVARKTFSLLSFNDDVGSFHLHGVYFILQTSNSYKDISICGRPRNAKCWRYIASCDFNASVCVMFGFQAMTIKTRTNGEREEKKYAQICCAKAVTVFHARWANKNREWFGDFPEQADDGWFACGSLLSVYDIYSSFFWHLEHITNIKSKCHLRCALFLASFLLWWRDNRRRK